MNTEHQSPYSERLHPQVHPSPVRLDVSTEIPLLRSTISGMLKDAADHRDETRAGCVALRLSHPYQKGGGYQRA